ncbi:hypothetical protein G6011_02894 [Alternaria panax]|uniref:Uncharacterized protein n=1 Tax=Alternaria panax TaxID=48097 RepID=A0AAD4FAG5_9PLEO|nr:hypothetical protein G6011_02894 [Alternaria panax]
MWQHHHDNSRPRKAPRVGKWQEERQKDDDLIAPDGVSESTDRLQRWALMTADMPQQPATKAKSRQIDEETQERIRKRYHFPRRLWPTTPPQDEPEPVDERMVVDLTGDDAHPKAPSPVMIKKRPHSPSPARDIRHTHPSTVSYVQTIKRRRSRSPSPKRSAYSALSARAYGTRALSTAASDEEYDYYQSSEWSFPSSDEEDEEMT